METLEAIYNRRSCRDYTNEPVSEKEINILLKAAFSAPTAVNAQPWEYIIINQTEVLNEIRDKMYFAKYNAPTAIVVCGNSNLAPKAKIKIYGYAIVVPRLKICY